MITNLSVELQMLAWSIVLGFVYMTLATAAITKQRGQKWNVSARDEKMPELTGLAARLDRAFQNFKETFPFFLAAVVISEFVSRQNAQQNHLSVIGVHVYFWARVVYIPLYAFGIPYVRTFVWLISAVGILLVLSSAFISV